jgi:hypothetical protein
MRFSLETISWHELMNGENKKSPDNVRAFTRVKDGARTRDLRNHNPAL